MQFENFPRGSMQVFTGTTFSTGFGPQNPGIPCIGRRNVFQYKISAIWFFQYKVIYHSNTRLTL